MNSLPELPIDVKKYNSASALRKACFKHYSVLENFYLDHDCELSDASRQELCELIECAYQDYIRAFAASQNRDILANPEATIGGLS